MTNSIQTSQTRPLDFLSFIAILIGAIIFCCVIHLTNYTPDFHRFSETNHYAVPIAHATASLGIAFMLAGLYRWSKINQIVSSRRTFGWMLVVALFYFVTSIIYIFTLMGFIFI